MQPQKLLYPILLENLPDWLSYVLADSGVPVVQSREEGYEYSIIINDMDIRSNDEFNNSLNISWRSLLPDHFINESQRKNGLYLPMKTGWIENGIMLSENCISDNLRASIISRLREIVLDNGYPWICFSPWPAGYDNIMNFRIDIDENEPDDWQRVIDALDPIRHATTWFLSVAATNQSPEIYDWLQDCDVNSHGLYHHIHRFDEKLNRSQLRTADDILKNAGFFGKGFAPPCGRITQGLLKLAHEMKYQFISGLGDPNGSLPFRNVHGIWQIHSLPVSEGLYLDNNISNSDLIIQGYLSAVSRALENQKPVFLYGHAERRLGRKPEILQQLIQKLDRLGNFWQVSLTNYMQWLNKRNKINFAVSFSNENNTSLQLKWSHSFWQARPELNIQWNNDDQNIALNDYSGLIHVQKRRDQHCQINVDAFNTVETFEIKEPWSLRVLLKKSLDWERETPPGVLIHGNMRSRLKAIFRWLTDKSWRKKHKRKEWKLHLVDFVERSKAA